MLVEFKISSSLLECAPASGLPIVLTFIGSQPLIVRCEIADSFCIEVVGVMIVERVV